MAQQQSPNPFHSDGAITSGADDMLGRKGFSHAIADRLITWNNDESLVASIYGKWGSGKSSVKNMILERINQRLSEGEIVPTVIEFNPWQFSGSDQLCEEFFESIADALIKIPGSSKVKAKADRVASAGRMRKYGQLLSGGSHALDTAALIASFTVPAVTPLFKAAGSGMKKLSSLPNEVSKPSDKPTSLIQLKSELREDLGKIERKLFVVVDDIDRLTSSEVCLLFRLIKANTDFPNIIFLLLVQRESAVAALDTVAHGQGDRFLEKIVQIPFDLPEPSPLDVGNVVIHGINSILTPLLREKNWEQERFAEAWHTTLSFYFDNLRVAYRYLNALTFSVGIFKTTNAFEVNAIDLLTLEAFRLYEPTAYEFLARNKELCTGDYHSSDTKRSDTLLSTLLSGAKNPASLQNGLALLFPYFDSKINNNNYGRDSWGLTWKRKRRACDPDFFDRYFQLILPASQVSESEITEFFESSSNRQLMFDAFERWKIKGAFQHALNRIEAEYLTEILDKTAFIGALLETFEGYEVPSGISMFERPERAVGIWARELLRKEKNSTTRDKMATDFINCSQAIFSLVNMARFLIPFDSSDKDSELISKSTSTKIRKTLARSIKAAASDQTLWLHPKLAVIFWSWMRLDKSTAHIWAQDQLKNPRFALRLLAAFKVKSTTSSGYSHKEQISIDLNSLEKIATIDEWKTALAQAETISLSDSDSLYFQLWNKAISRKSKGLPQDDWLDEDDEDQ